jgi:hypothetical protein
MFGTPKEHVLGAFDSEEELQVAERLIALSREELVAGLLPHPIVSGCTADFLIQFGAQGLSEGELMILEYDGLGRRRPEGLGQKRRSYGRLRRNGIYVRWLTSPDERAVRRACTGDYEPPNFARRIDICDRGHHQESVVIADTGDEELGSFERSISSSKCPKCNEQNRSSPR